MRGDQVRVRRSTHRARFLHPQGWSYYATLRHKLHWNLGLPDQDDVDSNDAHITRAGDLS